MKKLPEDWIGPLSAPHVPLSNLAQASRTYPDFKLWPLSLQNFVSGCRDLAMPRQPIEITTPSRDLQSAFISELDPILCLGMKAKKIHEVAHLSNVIHDLCGDFSEIVDVGSGKGYIAQALSHHFGYHVVGLEGNESQHEKAADRFSKTEKRRISKKEKYSAQSSDAKVSERKHATVNYMLEFGLETDALDSAVRTSLVKHENVCLMSLHACGDLSPCLLDVFVRWPRATSLVNVACCYHKIRHVKSVPMSRFVAESGFDLSPHIGWLELGTGCPLEFQKFDDLALEIRINKLAFRSVLQLLFSASLQQHPELATEFSDFVLHVQKMKSDAPFESLEAYLKVALPRSKLKRTSRDQNPVYAADLPWNWAQVQQEMHLLAPVLYNRYEPQRIAMKIWLALQASLASVAESLVLWDRWQYLEELSASSPVPNNEKTQAARSSHSSTEFQPYSPTQLSTQDSTIVPFIIPVFDQEESPRNLALIALKSSLKRAD
jgi:hypothetical protein